ncbi:MAG TPA: ABC transporter permease [Blastocatellia bacterium]|nr:ABC transporter permease [Blastocatellia bacterium]
MPEAQKELIAEEEGVASEPTGAQAPAAPRDASGSPSTGRGAPLREPEAIRSSEGPHPLVELTFVRVREFVREPEAMFWVFIFPILMACVLGIAFRNTAPELTRIAVERVSGDASGAGANKDMDRIVAALSPASNSFGLSAEALSPEQAAHALRTGKVAIIIRAVGGGDGKAPEIEYHYDPTRPESRTARLSVDDALQREFGRADVVSVREETRTEPGARYIDFLIPGLIGLNLMGSGMWGLGFAIVWARNRKLLKRLAATPMRKSHYLFSFMLSRLVFLAGEVAVVVAFAWFAFDVKVQGSLVSLAFLSVVGALSFGGIGLLVAARPKTVEGVSGLMNLVMVPMWLFSGTFFSSSRFPESVQPFIKALPLTALNDSYRAVMNEGLPLASTWGEISVLLVWALVSFAVALRIFRWQ